MVEHSPKYPRKRGKSRYHQSTEYIELNTARDDVNKNGEATRRLKKNCMKGRPTDEVKNRERKKTRR